MSSILWASETTAALPFSNGYSSFGRTRNLLLIETSKKVFGICNYKLVAPAGMLKAYKVKSKLGISIFSGVK